MAGAARHAGVKRRVLLAGLAAAGLAGCLARGPLRIGFLAGLVGRGAAIGGDGRNGAVLAVEQTNAAGGRLELLVQDNGDTADTARVAMDVLLRAQVQAIVGPFSSGLAVAVLPQAEQAGVLLVSPNATSSALAGRDDALFMMSPSTRAASQAYAALLWRRGQRRVALGTATDAHNAVYAKAWRDEFAAAFEALGGAVVARVDFLADVGAPYDAVVQGLLAPRPDGLVLVCGSVHAARLAQRTHALAPGVPLAVADAAGGEALIALGGRAVEGVVVGQVYDRSDGSARYAAFLAAFRQRFGREPGYHAVLSYDAVTVLAQAQARRSAGEGLRQAVLRHGPYDGLQQPIAFDRFGDADRPTHFVVVRGGRFEPLP